MAGCGQRLRRFEAMPSTPPHAQPAADGPVRLATDGSIRLAADGDRPSSLVRLLPSAPVGWYDRAAWLAIAVVLAIALTTFRDFGVTMDEAPHLGYGAHILNWYTSGFTDEGALTYRANYYYGGGYDLLGAIFRRIAAPMQEVIALHLLGCLVGVLGLIGTWKLGRLLGGPRAGLLALGIVTLNPVLYGHMFNNPKDTPFAVAYVWSLYFMTGMIARLPRPSRWTLVGLAISIGVTMSVRIGGMLLLCYLVLVLGLYALHAGWLRRSVLATEAQSFHALKIGAGVGLGAWMVMLLGWPWAQLDPLRRPFIALTRMSGFDAHERDMPFAGVEMSNFDLGWDYLVHYFAIQTPEPTLALALCGTLWGVYVLVRGVVRGELLVHHRQGLALLLLGMAIWLPPVYAVAKGSILYDNYRHFLFIIPPFSVLGALVLDIALGWARRRFGAVGAVVGAGLLVIASADIIYVMWRMHPHEYVYFNRIIGGLGGAVGHYDTDYYGNSYKEALEDLHARLWRTERKAYLNTVYTFTGCISGFAVLRHLPPNIIAYDPKKGDEGADFHTGYHRYHCHEKFPDAPVIVSVQREGGELCVVKDLRPLRGLKKPPPVRVKPGAKAEAPNEAQGEPGDEPAGAENFQ